GDVVHTVVDQVGAHGGVQLHFKGHLQFGSDSVDAGDQHGVRVLGFVDGKEGAEAANFAEHSASEGLVRQVLNALLGAVGPADVNPGIGVGDRGGAGGWSLGHGFVFV